MVVRTEVFDALTQNRASHGSCVCCWMHNLHQILVSRMVVLSEPYIWTKHNQCKHGHIIVNCWMMSVPKQHRPSRSLSIILVALPSGVSRSREIQVSETSTNQVKPKFGSVGQFIANYINLQNVYEISMDV